MQGNENAVPSLPRRKNGGKQRVKPELNIGLLGFGAMGKAHAYCINTLDFYYTSLPFRARIFGICTTSEEKSSKIGEQFHIPVTCANEDALIYDPNISIIDVCTPNCYHYDTVKKALAAGKHVYCEKPLCVTAAQARELAELAEKSGKICNMVFNNRHLAPVLRAAELVREGRIGRLLSFSAEYLHNSCTDTLRPAGWKQDREICGGGVLFDLGSHVIDLIYSLCGEFHSVYGMSQIAYPQRTGRQGQPWETNADEGFYMLCRMKSGAMGTITVSKLIKGANDDLSFSLYGEKGCLKFSLMQPNYLYFYDATNPQTPLGGNSGYQAIECVGRYPAPGGAFPSPKAASGWLRGHVESMYQFLSSVYDGQQRSPSFADGAYVQAVMEAAYRSSEQQKEILLP